jgi:hypothetical protein
MVVVAVVSCGLIVVVVAVVSLWSWQQDIKSIILSNSKIPLGNQRSIEVMVFRLSKNSSPEISL